MYNFYNLYESKNIPRHKTFISFHHTDQYYKNLIESKWGKQLDGYVSKSVQEGDIDTSLSTNRIRQIIRDDFIAKATVTIVLIGNSTWRRKYVDWEIGSSIRKTKNNPRTGLLGIVLPTYRPFLNYYSINNGLKNTENGGWYSPYNIPPRLYDNIKCGFAKIYSWSDNNNDILEWIDKAFERKDKIIPNNSYDSFANNRSNYLSHWS
ncbi:MAG: TIR domain-containing protein [Sphaerochaetaceae bacterium]|nr:TIR domain-containing protein [Sphaerochaetaceae bacterium]